MRVMIINHADKFSEAGVMPSEKLLAGMGALMGDMAAAGVLLAGDGLKASSHGKRIAVAGGKRTVTDGPFTETKELVAGFCIIKVDSMDEAVAWAQRFIDVFDGEVEDGYTVELRPMFEAEDFGDEFTPELRDAEERLRAQIGQNA
jgi:hypothetical protein